MVLDTYQQSQELFVYKNTHDDEINGQPKQFKIRRDDQNAPEEFLFVHIELRDMDNLKAIDSSETSDNADGIETESLLQFESVEKTPNKNSVWSFCCCCSR